MLIPRTYWYAIKDRLTLEEQFQISKATYMNGGKRGFHITEELLGEELLSKLKKLLGIRT
jgi:hypothetical protein